MRKLNSFSVYGGGYTKEYAELLGAVGGEVMVRGSTTPSQPGVLTKRMKA
ncbi:MAG: hypothetical protein HOI15_17185 [Opitutales bacterium]|jgi:hypothetical protein|nr:hypothetical protein [Opitutales bacterium]